MMIRYKFVYVAGFLFQEFNEFEEDDVDSDDEEQWKVEDKKWLNPAIGKSLFSSCQLTNFPFSILSVLPSPLVAYYFVTKELNVMEYKHFTGLIKAARSCLKKSITATEKAGAGAGVGAGASAGAGAAGDAATSKEHISELDVIAERVGAISPAVDDLVTAMYPPLNSEALTETVLIYNAT